MNLNPRSGQCVVHYREKKSGSTFRTVKEVTGRYISEIMRKRSYVVFFYIGCGLEDTTAPKPAFECTLPSSPLPLEMTLPPEHSSRPAPTGIPDPAPYSTFLPPSQSVLLP